MNKFNFFMVCLLILGLNLEASATKNIECESTRSKNMLKRGQIEESRWKCFIDARLTPESMLTHVVTSCVKRSETKQEAREQKQHKDPLHLPVYSKGKLNLFATSTIFTEAGYGSSITLPKNAYNKPQFNLNIESSASSGWSKDLFHYIMLFTCQTK